MMQRILFVLFFLILVFGFSKDKNLSVNRWDDFPLKKIMGSYLFDDFIKSSIKLGSTTKASRGSFAGMSVRLDDKKNLYFLRTDFHQAFPWGNSAEYCYNFKEVYINRKRNKIKLVSIKSQVKFVMVKGISKSGKLKDFKISTITTDGGSLIKLEHQSYSDYMVSVMFKKRYETINGEKLVFLGNGKAILLGKKYDIGIQLDGNSPGDESIFFKEKVDGKEVWHNYIYEIRGNELLLFKVKPETMEDKGKLAFKFKAF